MFYTSSAKFPVDFSRTQKVLVAHTFISFAIQHSYAQSLKVTIYRKKLRLVIFFHIFVKKNEVGYLHFTYICTEKIRFVIPF